MKSVYVIFCGKCCDILFFVNNVNIMLLNFKIIVDDLLNYVFDYILWIVVVGVIFIICEEIILGIIIFFL